ncbi:MAG TPA: hypothetical protein VLT13_03070 [Bacteroidota bacterium]|nr:hypothetical protein [Bacteroidota bacterium]
MVSKFFLKVGMVVLGLGIVGCSSDPPSVRIMNERTTKANVQLKVGTDNTININDVEGGKASAYRDVSEGTFVATATIQNESVSPTTTFNTEEDMNYTVVVVNSTPPTLRVDSEDK